MCVIVLIHSGRPWLGNPNYPGSAASFPPASTAAMRTENLDDWHVLRYIIHSLTNSRLQTIDDIRRMFQ